MEIFGSSWSMLGKHGQRRVLDEVHVHAMEVLLLPDARTMPRISTRGRGEGIQVGGGHSRWPAHEQDRGRAVPQGPEATRLEHLDPAERDHVVSLVRLGGHVDALELDHPRRPVVGVALALRRARDVGASAD